LTELFVGIDVGTYASKGVVVRRDGLVVARASRPHRMIVPRPGWAEHRAVEDWWGDFTAICQALLAHPEVSPDAIAAVGCSGIGPCMLPVDGDGEPLMNAVLYGVDTRAMQEVRELTEQLGEPAIIRQCGTGLNAQSAGAKILWLRRHRPDLFERTHRVLNSNSFLIFRLTGRYVIDHYSAGSFTPLYSVARDDWDVDFAGVVDAARLPELCWSTDVVGAVSEKAAAETGLRAGTPVIAGTTDAAAEAASVGVRRDGDMMVMYGSTIFIIAVHGTPATDGRLWRAPWLEAGRHASMAGVSTAGTLTHWFRDNFARELDAADPFAMLGREAAASPPGARGLLCLPYFSGALTPLFDADAKGVIFGLDLTHGRGDLARAMYEGIAFATRHILDTYQQSGVAVGRIMAVGGGTQSPVWLQAVSDVTGYDQHLRRENIGASYGDALLAAIGVGALDWAGIEAWNPVVATTTPDASLRAIYDEGFHRFRELYSRTRGLLPTRAAVAG
jgi:xylulokinase